jgi:hypothetical protein
MYHEAMYLMVQLILKNYGSAGKILPTNTLFYVIGNVCSPAWDNNVIG